MNMRHCPFSLIKKCGLKGCETCKFNSGIMRSQEGNEMKVIRYGSFSKIYPKDISLVDTNKFDTNVSLLYSVMTDEDIINMNKAKKSESYKKGVI